MARWQYTKGLHDLGNGHYAWLLPDGSWGWSNAGLIEDAGETLLVDTLFDLNHTREMLGAMRGAVPAAKRLGAVVNTHANGDHFFGNQLVEGARIIASKACAEDMYLRPPAQYAAWQKEWPKMGVAGRFWQEVIGSRFEFSGIRVVPPTETFSGTLTLKVGDKEVRLVEVGPAHTRGDVLVYVPQDRVLYTGDMLFNGGHPAIWAGPSSNWVKACDLMLSWDLDVVVPGHGAITDKACIREFRDYLEYVRIESRRCFDAGMSFLEAADAISLDPWAHLGEAERIVLNVYACYREFGGGAEQDKPDILRMLELMGERHFRSAAR
jgi:glyoxylase-like metal-dependent hydrolase (beta-lactamase superfamily II)